ncbi:MAG: class I SAM-dependent methyltransferase [Alphaproteobacteria bacterium]|nr:class I SAM-dependent methyltransferase [Alphaproteobacteria bacterium]
MSKNALETLWIPFVQGALSYPDPGQKVLFLGAQNHPELTRFKSLRVSQDFYPYAVSLKTRFPELLLEKPAFVPGSVDMALCLVPSQTQWAQGMLAEALLSLKPGGVLMAAAGNDAGGKRLPAWFRQAGLFVHSQSKNHARVVWGTTENLHRDVVMGWHKAAAAQEKNIEGEMFWTEPGLFSWNRVDMGSRILAEFLPHDLTGIAGDFGCGYGWLSRQILVKNKTLKALYVMDADRRAVTACVKNLRITHPNIEVTGIWTDLTQRDQRLPKLDVIVMNPPFHEGKKTDIDIGHQFIENAAGCLKPGGQIWMVANQHLPYEVILMTYFSHVIPIAEKNGFKIFNAWKESA